jgi:hypothetical protein
VDTTLPFYSLQGLCCIIQNITNSFSLTTWEWVAIGSPGKTSRYSIYGCAALIPQRSAQGCRGEATRSWGYIDEVNLPKRLFLSKRGSRRAAIS